MDLERNEPGGHFRSRTHRHLRTGAHCITMTGQETERAGIPTAMIAGLAAWVMMEPVSSIPGGGGGR